MKSPQDFLHHAFRYAVVGASADETKYGNIVFKDLRSAGLTVIPVNPKLTELDGVPAAAAVEEIQPLPDVVVMVVPPNVGLDVLRRAAAAGIEKFWFQPGAESAEIRAAIQNLGVAGMADGSCIMVARRNLGIEKTAS